MSLPVPALHLGVAFVVTTAAATVQGVTGLGFALVSVPILALMNPALVPVPQLLVVFPLTLAMAWRERRDVELAGVGWILAGRPAGALLGIGLIKMADAVLIEALIGLAVLAAVVMAGSNRSWRRCRATEVAAGVASGTMGIVSAIGGPPVALLYRNERGPRVRGNLALVFALGLCITLGTRFGTNEVSRRDLLIALWLFPAVLAGYGLSRLMLRQLGSGASLRRPILVIVAAAGLAILGRAAAQTVG